MASGHPPGDDRAVPPRAYRRSSPLPSFGRPTQLPIDGRATPAPVDGRAAPPPVDGRVTPPPGDGHAKPPPEDRRRRPFRDDGLPSPFSQSRGGHGSANIEEKSGEGPSEIPRRNVYSGLKLGLHQVVGNVRNNLHASRPINNSIKAEMPRLAIYQDIVHGPPLTRCQEAELKEQLESALKQMQLSLKSMGLQPVYIEMVEPVPLGLQISQTVRGRRGELPIRGRSDVFLRPSRVKLLPYTMLSWSSVLTALTTEETLVQTQEQNKHLVEIIEKVSFEIKLQIACGLENEHITEDFAKELLLIVACMDKNLQLAMKAGGHFFSVAGLLEKVWQKMPDDAKTYFGEVKNWGQFGVYAVKFTERAISCIGTNHGQFKSIGQEANGILDDDYSSDHLKPSSEPYANVSCGLGAERSGLGLMRHLILKLRTERNSVSFNWKSFVGVPPAANGAAANGAAAAGDAAAAGNVAAPANLNHDNFITRISIDNPLGNDMKCVIKIPYPDFNGKIEVRRIFSYAQCAASLESVPNPAGAHLRGIPVLDVSALFGISYVGAGFRFQLKRGQLSSSLGMSIRTKLLALGMTCKRSGEFKATICKELVDSNTTLAVRASYLPPPGAGQPPLEAGLNPGFKFTLGMKHVVDPTLYGKARIGTEGASLLIKKSSATGMFSLKGAVHLDFNEPRSRSKVGVVFSVRS